MAKSSRVRIDGVKEFTEALAADLAGVQLAIHQAVFETANEVLNEAKKEVPFATGNLSSTGDVLTSKKSDVKFVMAEVSFGGPTKDAPDGANYAFIVHEKDLNHDPPKYGGGKKKYLEDPFNRAIAQWPDSLVKKVRTKYHFGKS